MTPSSNKKSQMLNFQNHCSKLHLLRSKFHDFFPFFQPKKDFSVGNQLPQTDVAPTPTVRNPQFPHCFGALGISALAAPQETKQKRYWCWNSNISNIKQYTVLIVVLGYSSFIGIYGMFDWFFKLRFSDSKKIPRSWGWSLLRFRTLQNDILRGALPCPVMSTRIPHWPQVQCHGYNPHQLLAWGKKTWDGTAKSMKQQNSKEARLR